MALTRLNSRILCSLKQSNLGLVSVKRTFLSDSFDMKVEWNDRLKAPIFGVIDMEKYFLDIDRQFNITGLASHIDLDIFANALLLSKNDGIISNTQDIETRFEQIEELLRRFRTTSGKSLYEFLVFTFAFSKYFLKKNIITRYQMTPFDYPDKKF